MIPRYLHSISTTHFYLSFYSYWGTYTTRRLFFDNVLNWAMIAAARESELSMVTGIYQG